MHAAAFRGLDTIIGLINQRDSIKEPLVVLLRFLYGSSPTKLSTLITKRIPKRVEDPAAYIAFAHDLLRNHTFMSGNVHYPIPRIMSKKGAELPPVNLAAIALVESRIVPDLIHMAFRAVEPRANIVQAAAEEGDGEFQFLPKENTSTAPVRGTTDQGGEVMSWEVRQAALALLVDAWIHFTSIVEEDMAPGTPKRILTAVRHCARDSQLQVVMFATSCLENLLSHFCASSNAHTSHVYKAIIFTLIETGQGRGNTNARIVRDHVCDMVAGIMVQEGMQRAPIGVLLDPIVRQVTSETGMPLDQPEFRLFMSLSSHQRLEVGSALPLCDLMARTVLHDNSLHAQLAAHVIASVARYQGHKAGIREYLHRFCKVALSAFMRLEARHMEVVPTLRATMQKKEVEARLLQGLQNSPSRLTNAQARRFEGMLDTSVPNKWEMRQCCITIALTRLIKVETAIVGDLSDGAVGPNARLIGICHTLLPLLTKARKQLRSFSENTSKAHIMLARLKDMCSEHISATGVFGMSDGAAESSPMFPDSPIMRAKRYEEEALEVASDFKLTRRSKAETAITLESSSGVVQVVKDVTDSKADIPIKLKLPENAVESQK